MCVCMYIYIYIYMKLCYDLLYHITWYYVILYGIILILCYTATCCKLLLQGRCRNVDQTSYHTITHTILYYVVSCHIILYYIILYYSIELLYYTLLYYIILYYIIYYYYYYYIILYYTILCYSIVPQGRWRSSDRCPAGLFSCSFIDT